MKDATIGDLETVHQPAAASTPVSRISKRFWRRVHRLAVAMASASRHSVLSQRLLSHTDLMHCQLRRDILRSEVRRLL
jgi:hypothetical protein